MLGTIFGIGAQYLMNQLNNQQAAERAEYDRLRNYQLNERAAQNADYRTRQLYADFYSPEAQLRQTKAAGLSPSIYYGGTPGGGGMSGAQGGGSNIQTPYMPMSLLEGAQIANIKAQTEAIKAEIKKTKAETGNIDQDTRLKTIEELYKDLELQQFKTEWNVVNSTWTDIATGKETSLFEMAEDYYSYDEFLEAIRKNSPEPIKEMTQSEAGQAKLREIYHASNQFRRDIMVLSEETINSKFQIDILEKLKDNNFINLNAEAAVAQLKQSIATNELTEQQKNAWNNLINRLSKKGSTMKDIVIVLGMILGNFASNSGIKLKLGK